MIETFLVSLIPLCPLLTAVFIGLLALAYAHDPDGPPRGVVALLACAGPMAACVISAILFAQLADHPAGFNHQAFTWFSVGGLDVPAALYVDRLSGVMIMIVTFVGSLIHLYSVGYMGHERGFARFFAYMNLFTFAMLVLVLGQSLPVMFLGWEGVGACSYFLIGYYFTETEKAKAANKAFIVNRVGDFGFLLGIFVLFWYLGSKGLWTMDFPTLKAHAGLFTPQMATVIGLLLFVGAAGKSAQIPLHVWLADAMAGPTPVSALIHAATMVTAGVYMVARMSFMYDLAPVAGGVIATVGIATALMAATIALTQTNIKKVLAYSTVSQLGYMFAGVGAGAYAAGVFHLFTHAFFKALLFLGAGAVIHAMHHEEELGRYGGLRKKLPFTFAVMGIGCLAIAGFPPLAGFFSKDAILLATWEKGWTGLYWVGLFTSFLTAFYMFRMFFLTFYGAPRGGDAYAHAQEGPWTMNAPLAVLAIGSVVVGFLGLPAAMGGSSFAAWLAPAVGLAHDPTAHLAGDALKTAQAELYWLEYTLMSLAIVAGALGLVFAALRYALPAVPHLAAPRGLFYIFAKKYGFDEAYDWLFVKGSIALVGWGLWKVVDDYLIDGVVRGVPWLYLRFADSVRVMQSGMARSYAITMVVGAAAMLVFVMSHFALLRF